MGVSRCRVVYRGKTATSCNELGDAATGLRSIDATNVLGLDGIFGKTSA